MRSIASDRRGYDGRWWEFQANRAIGGILLPRALVFRCIAGLAGPVGGLGVPALAATNREEAARRLVARFEVNPVVARIRLDDLYPAGEAAQLTL